MVQGAGWGWFNSRDFKGNKPVHERVRDLFAHDIPLPGVNIKGGVWTIIEAMIHNYVDGTNNAKRGMVEPGVKLRGFFPTADCMKITCGGKMYCIGSDKIGHMFQQGHMLYEVMQAKGVQYAIAFSEWTEGLRPRTSRTEAAEWDDVTMWLESMESRFQFYGFGPDDTLIRGFYMRWGGALDFNLGGIPIAQISPGDNAANQAGMKLYDDIERFFADPNHARGLYSKGDRFTFNMCDYLSPTMEDDGK